MSQTTFRQQAAAIPKWPPQPQTLRKRCEAVDRRPPRERHRLTDIVTHRVTHSGPNRAVPVWEAVVSNEPWERQRRRCFHACLLAPKLASLEHEPKLKLRQKGVDGPLFVKRSEHKRVTIEREENKPADPWG